MKHEIRKARKIINSKFKTNDCFLIVFIFFLFLHILYFFEFRILDFVLTFFPICVSLTSLSCARFRELCENSFSFSAPSPEGVLRAGSRDTI